MDKEADVEEAHLNLMVNLPFVIQTLMLLIVVLMVVIVAIQMLIANVMDVSILSLNQIILTLKRLGGNGLMVLIKVVDVVQKHQN